MIMEEIIVMLNNITKKYGGTTAVNNCSLELKKNQIYGLAGKNGAGKTTIMRIIAGLCIATKGEAKVAAERIGTLIEAPALNGDMTAKENLRFYSMLCGGKGEFLSDDELLELVGLTEVKRKKVKNFSLGMKQRLGIAAALVGNPEFLMLDEPVNGLDPLGVIEIRKLIKRLNREYGMTVLISSHNLPELYQTADQYIIIDKGTVKKEISQAELEKESFNSLEEYFLSVIG